MARQLRIEFDSAFYHITSRGNLRDDIFFEDKDREKFLEILKRTKERYRLVGINGYKPDCSPLTASFRYDALGRRTGKTINGTTTQYLYDGFDIIQELQGGVPTQNYVRSLFIDEPLTRIKSDGAIRHYVSDALGSVIALMDDSGVVKTTYTYDPFGNVTISGETSDNPFQFAGRENDGAGLLYERFRYYSPELQRYISQDPIGLAGGDVNFYSRVRNNPPRYRDPYGLLSGWEGVKSGIDNGIAAGGEGAMTGAIIGGITLGGLGTATGFPGAGWAAGAVGGWVGGKIGGLFDPPGAGQLNYNEPYLPITPVISKPGPIDPPSIHMPPQKPLEPSKCH